MATATTQVAQINESHSERRKEWHAAGHKTDYRAGGLSGEHGCPLVPDDINLPKPRNAAAVIKYGRGELLPNAETLPGPTHGMADPLENRRAESVNENEHKSDGHSEKESTKGSATSDAPTGEKTDRQQRRRQDNDRAKATQQMRSEDQHRGA